MTRQTTIVVIGSLRVKHQFTEVSDTLNFHQLTRVANEVSNEFRRHLNHVADEILITFNINFSVG